MVNSSNNDIDSWQNEARCRELDNVELFFEQADERKAKKFCNLCPVRADCLEYALVYDVYGIWGGTTRVERYKKYSAEYRKALRDDLEESGFYNSSLKV